MRKAKMKRYDLYRCGEDGSEACRACLQEVPSGKYVTHEDAQEAIDLIIKIRGVVDMACSFERKYQHIITLLHGSSVGCIGVDQ